MASTKDIRDWLIKMQYRDPNPSEETLNLLCKGNMGFIFQQLIDKIKPRNEIKCDKLVTSKLASITLENSLLNDSLEFEVENKIKNNEISNLQTELHNLNSKNLENQMNLQHLTSKVKSKYATSQILKDKLLTTEKDVVLLKAKVSEIEKQIESCGILNQDFNKIFDNCSEQNDVLSNKISSTLLNLEEVILNFSQEISKQNTPSILINTLDIPHNSYLHTSMILSSSKKPLSTSKRSKRANSTRKNIFDTSNVSTISTTSNFRRNLSRIGSFNNTILSVTNGISGVNENLNEIEQKSWETEKIQNSVKDIMWHFKAEQIFQFMNELRNQQTRKIIEAIAKEETSSNTHPKSNTGSNNGLEKIYSLHVEIELKKMKCKLSQEKISKMIEQTLNDNINEITILESTEVGIKTSLVHLHDVIIKMQEEYPDNSEKLNQILEELQTVQSDIKSTESQINATLNLLHSSGLWLNKTKSNICEVFKKREFYSEYEYLQENCAEEDLENFISCPFQQCINIDLDKWQLVYKLPEFMESFQYSFLSPDRIKQLEVNQKHWKQLLQSMEKEDVFSNVKLLPPPDIENNKKADEDYKNTTEKLKAVVYKCKEIMCGIDKLNATNELNSQFCLNDIVDPNEKYNDKCFKDYVKEYDEYYNLL